MTTSVVGPLQAKWLQLETEMRQQFLEREPEIRGLMLAALSGSHIEFIGPPGNAKSAMLAAFAKRLGVSKSFDMLMTKFSTPDEVFGPIDLVALKTGHYQRIIAGKLPEAEVAYLDEIYKANSAILNALLRVLQERVYNNNGVAVQCPLLFCVGASNEFPDKDEGLAALHDRFLLRYNPGYIAAEDNFLSMLKLPTHSEMTTSFTDSELRQSMMGVKMLTFNSSCYTSILMVKSGLKDEGLVFSDRRYKQALAVMAADAWLRGVAQVDSESVLVLEHILWEKPEQQRIIAQIVRKAVNPNDARITELLEAARDAVGQVQRNSATKQQDILTMTNQVRDMRAELDALPQSAKRDSAQQEFNDLMQRLVQLLIGKRN